MKTLILTCSRNDSYCGGYVTGLMQAMTSPHFGGWLKMEHESDIARGRSKLMGQALETKFDSFLWVDDDIVWTRDDFDAICSLPVRARAMGVRVREGATQLTRIFGASSAPSASVRPSTAPLAIATEA